MSFTIDIRDKEGLRTLNFETVRVQGAMRIDDPWALALEYTRVMMAALLLRGVTPEQPLRVLLIGLGAGSQAKFLYRYFPQAQLTVVEISPRVVEAARTHFALPDDPARLQIVIGDGYDHVLNSSEQFDLILVDGFNEHAHPGDLNTRAFYQACQSRLSAQGIVAVNLIGVSHASLGGFVHIQAVFGSRAILFPRCKSGNTIAFALAGETIEVSRATLRTRAHALEQASGLALISVLDRLDEAIPHPGDCLIL